MGYYNVAAFTHKGCAWHGVCPHGQDSSVSYTCQNKKF